MQSVNRKNNIMKITFGGIFLAIALVLPFITAQIPEIGKALCPMHIPVLLCGYVCGGAWGLAVGAIAPLMRSFMFGMPKIFPDAVSMTFELAAYGLLAGILFRALPKKTVNIYVSLVISMIGGRLVWGTAKWILSKVAGFEFTLKLFLGGALLNAIPGIIAQIVLVPVLVIVFKRTGLISDWSK